MMRLVAITTALVLTLGSSSPVAYLKLGATLDGRVIDATWRQQPIGYFISERNGTGVSAADLRGAVERAAATWSASSSGMVSLSYHGMTTAPAEGTDGRNTIGFLDRPDLDGVLGSGAVMFPIALTPGAVADRVLQPDDIAGISDLYSGATAITDTGGIVGRVTKNGQGVNGAHVVAFNPESGSLIGNFTLTANGDFVIARLPPGPYILRVEPLDDADPESFLGTPIDANFQVTYAPRMVVAPEGGSSSPIEIRVLPK
jgi:hypothetical protein